MRGSTAPKIKEIMNLEVSTLPRIDLLQIVIIKSRFHHFENKKTIISMISGISNLSPSPKTNNICLWRHQDTWKKSRNP